MLKHFTSTLLAAVTLTTHMQTYADEYQNDISYSRQTKKYHQMKAAYKTTSITQYFDEVPDKNFKLLDAALLSRVASIRFDYTTVKSYGPTVYEEGYLSAVNYQHMIPESSLWLNFKIGSGKVNDDALGDPAIDRKVKYIYESGIGIGFFLSNNSILSINHHEQSRMGQSIQVTGGVTNDNVTISDNYLNSRTIFLSDDNTAFELEFSAGTKTLRNNDITFVRNESYTLTSNYYFNRYNSFGLSYTSVTGEQSINKGDKAHISIGMTEPTGFILKLDYEKFKRADKEGEYEMYSFTAGFKF